MPFPTMPPPPIIIIIIIIIPHVPFIAPMPMIPPRRAEKPPEPPADQTPPSIPPTGVSHFDPTFREITHYCGPPQNAGTYEHLAFGTYWTVCIPWFNPTTDPRDQDK